MPAAHLPGTLRRVVREMPLAIDVAERFQRETFGRLQRLTFPLRINGTEEEQTIPHDRSTKGHAGITEIRRDRVHGPLEALHGVVLRFEIVRTRVGKAAAFQ